ncbi:hypothetical protein GALMADRAFT_907559 [Galerina marginata CBS 339.88]|uniref:Uncharacterized protein n=1 Tax=Galerina marginata (strain CBS 339.88) TaxID=685588 RepID=A0A067SFM4_GALM3|nr:hypothetical protein GALMADRAFT_907559 [Galerina marginata CBS 339.88]
MNSTPETIASNPNPTNFPKENSYSKDIFWRLPGLIDQAEKELDLLDETLEALKGTINRLEVQTHRLRSDVSEIRGLVTQPLEQITPIADSSPASDAETAVPVQEDSHRRSFITPPSTPGRLIRLGYLPVNSGISDGKSGSISQDTSTFNVATQLTPVGILGKRSSPEETSNYEKACKRVHFAEIGDIPTSDLRTPTQHLDITSKSDNLILPIPKVAAGISTSVNQNTEESHSQTPQSGSSAPLSPPSTPIILPGRGKSSRPRYRPQDGPFFFQISGHPRQKTRWDPETGKRIPVNLS